MASCGGDEDEFKWGKQKRLVSNDRSYYKSVYCQGEEYSLNDCIQVYDEREPEGHIAKIMKLWEDIATGQKMTQLRWFLRPAELPDGVLPATFEPNELFLAFGKGKGVTNQNRLDCIYKKSKVLCTSKDARNKQPSEEDLQSADYIFDKIYNVDRMQLSNVEVVVEVLGCDVFFNKPEWVSSGRRKVQVERSGSNAKTPAIATPYALQGDTVLISAVEGGQEHTYIGDHKGGCLPSKSEGGQLEEVKKKVIHNEKQAMQQVSPTKDGGGKHMKERVKVEESCQVEKSVSQAVPVKKQSDTVGNVSAMSEKGNVAATAEKWVLDLSEAKQLEMSSLATTRLSVFPTHAEKAWDDNLAESITLGRVLHIQNIDPSFTSVDIQDLLSCFFSGLSDAQMLPQCYVSRVAGSALEMTVLCNMAVGAWVIMGLDGDLIF